MKALLVIFATSFGDEDGCEVRIYKMVEASFDQFKGWLMKMQDDYKACLKEVKKLGYEDPDQLIREYHNEFLSPTHYVTIEGHTGSYLSYNIGEIERINGQNKED